MRNVLLLAYRFPPLTGGGVYRNAAFVRYLPQFGYRPIVVTASPGARPQGGATGREPWDRSLLAETAPDLVVERVANFEVMRVLTAACRRLGGSALLRWCFWPDEAVVWSTFAVLKGERAVGRLGADVICASGGPFSTFLAGVALKALTGRPLVLDFRDPWTHNLTRRWPTRWHFRLDRLAEQRVLALADAIVMNTLTARSYLLEEYPQLAAQKVHVITNGYDEEDFPPGPSPPEGLRPAGGTSPRPGKRFRIVHAGRFYEHYELPGHGGGLHRLVSGLGRRRTVPPRQDSGSQLAGHSPICLLRAVSALYQERPELRGALELVFAGPFHANDRRLIAQLGLADTVRVLGQVPHDRCVRLMHSADLLFLTHFGLPADLRNPHTGGRTYEYVASMKPILALLPEGDAKDIVKQSGLGIFCPREDVAAVKDTLLRLYQQHLSGGITVTPDVRFIRQFERRGLTGKLAAIFDSVITAEQGTTATSGETWEEGRAEGGATSLGLLAPGSQDHAAPRVPVLEGPKPVERGG